MSDWNVLHLITRFLKGGGAETTTINTLEALRKSSENYDLHLGYGAEYDPERVRMVRDRGVNTVCFDAIRHYNPVTSVLAVYRVATYLRHEQIDILHTHSTEAGIIGRLAGQLAGTPIIIHEIHGDPITDDRSRFLNGFLLRAERFTAPMTTAIIAKSERIRDDYLSRGIGRDDQYQIIYHGIDMERFSDGGRSPTSTDVVTLLFVGRLARGKGLSDLLAAVDRLKENHTIQLCIAGTGELSDVLPEQIHDQGLDDVELLGYRSDIPDLMAAADVLVLPSYREGTPRVITEALASGLPVVSTAIAGIPEQVSHGETGLLVEPGDVNALTDALGQLIDNPTLREQMGDQAKTRVEKFNVSKIQYQFIDLYSSLVSDL